MQVKRVLSSPGFLTPSPDPIQQRLQENYIHHHHRHQRNMNTNIDKSFFWWPIRAGDCYDDRSGLERQILGSTLCNRRQTRLLSLSLTRCSPGDANIPKSIFLVTAVMTETVGASDVGVDIVPSLAEPDRLTLLLSLSLSLS